MKRLRITLLVLLFLNPIRLPAQVIESDTAGVDRTKFVCTNGAAGTTLNRIAKFSGAPSKCVNAGTTDTNGLAGITVLQAGTTGNAWIQRFGLAFCDFDGSTVAGDWVQASVTTGGKCHDAGTAQPGSGDTVGRVMSTNAGGVGTYDLLVDVRHPAPSGQMISWCTGAVGTGNGTTYQLIPSSNATGCNANGGAENPVVSACIAQNLQVKASAAGAVAGSGVVALFKNGSASALTCTLGTTLTCSDTTHTVALTTSDAWSVRITTGQASDTTANPRAVFQCL